MKKMCIIYYSDYVSWPVGGMLQYLHNIIPDLSQNYDLTIYGCSVNSNFHSSINIDGKEYTIKRLGNVKTKQKIIPNYFKYLFDMYKWAKKIDAENYDIIYIHNAPVYFAYKLRVKKSKALLVFHQHGLSKMNRFFEYFQNYSMKNADLVFINADLQSIREKERELKISEKTFIQVTGQVNTKKFIPNFSKCCLKTKLNLNYENIFIYTGRITQSKDPLFLIESFNIFYEKYNKNSCLLLVGDGEMTPLAKQRIKDLSLEKNIFITGFLSHEDIISYLQVSDAFLMASYGEGMSLSVVEGMACGLPVIGFDVNGIRELIKSEYNGIIVQERNNSDFASGMYKVIQNKREFSLNALNYSQNFSIKNITSIIIEQINSKL